jgi:hypothetical protein
MEPLTLFHTCYECLAHSMEKREAVYEQAVSELMEQDYTVRRTAQCYDSRVSSFAV